ncbi:MAG TPA: site-specific integrase [Steroidobacteraceae bacterium]
MAGKHLTARSVNRLPYRPSGAGWCIYWHGGKHRLPGFGFRVTVNGARTYVVRYRVKGSRRQRIFKLGSSTVLSFTDAFKRAREVLREAERGVDWFAQVKRERSVTVADVWKHYEQEHLATDNVSAGSRANARALWRLHSEREFKSWALVDLKREDVRRWHNKLAAGKRGQKHDHNANRALQNLRAAWNFGVANGRIPRALDNPFASIKLHPEHPRQTILEPHQFAAFANAVNGLNDPYARAYVWLLFHTGCRRTELLKLALADVELLPKRGHESRSGTITLRHVKRGESRKVALCAPAVELLEGLPPIKGNAYVFCGTREGTHLDPKDHWERVRKAAGLKELRLHDLRRTFGSWLGASGVSTKLIGTVLGHRTDITSRVYVQLGQAADIKRELVAAHAALAEQFAKEKPRASVVDLKARAHR